MSYRARLFNKALVNALGGEGGGRSGDYLSNTIKCALLTDSWTPDPTLEVYGDLTDEFSGGGYTAGGATLSGKTITYDGSLGTQWLKFQADPAAWGASFPIRYAVIYNSSVTDQPLYGWVDVGHVLAGSEEGSFEVCYDNQYGLYERIWFSIATTPPDGAPGAGLDNQKGWRWFPRAWGNIFGGLSGGQARQTDFLSDTINVGLLESSWTPAGTEQVWADVSGNEIDGSGGYTALEISGKTLAFDSATRRTILSCDDMVWDGVDIADAFWAALYNDTPTDKPLLGYLPLMVDRTTSDEFRIKTHTSGVLRVRVT